MSPPTAYSSHKKMWPFLKRFFFKGLEIFLDYRCNTSVEGINDDLRLKCECPVFSLSNDRHMYSLRIFVYIILRNTEIIPYILFHKSLDDILWRILTCQSSLIYLIL